MNTLLAGFPGWPTEVKYNNKGITSTSSCTILEWKSIIIFVAHFISHIYWETVFRIEYNNIEDNRITLMQKRL